MLDFSSALYLGLRHPSSALPPWERLTTGRPAALGEPPAARAVARRLARLVGCAHAVLAPSTLHVFWDLLGLLSKERVAIYLDAGSYPIARWGVDRAAARGTPVRRFPSHDAGSLESLVRHGALQGLRPIVVTDGLCPATGQPAPVAAYLEATRRFEGYLVMDDTQALGILGAQAGPGIPYGRGGGGTLRWAGASSANAIVVSSLAKGFGVPVAMLGGDEALVRRFEEESETRAHCSPPSAAVVLAAGSALALNTAHGDTLRRRLLQRVRQFRAGLVRLRLAANGNLFPVQTLMPAPSVDPVGLHKGLRDRGVYTVLHRARAGQDPRMSFIFTARHSARDVEVLLDLLAEFVWSPQAEHSWG